MGKTLVAYFSASGITAKVAKKLADIRNADLYEIRPETPYTEDDLNWSDRASRTSLESSNPASRPALADRDANIAAYDTIFLGFPIWWYKAPHIINTFLEAYDFSGKRIITFATSGGSKFGKTMASLQPSCSDTVIWKQGEVLNGDPSRSRITEWVSSLKL
ncbi:MAG: flavodoxin [Mitsuokella sp.]|mgnify:FL=1